MLAQQTIPLTRVDNLQIAHTDVDDSRLDNKEPVIDCSDCFDSMIKIYGSDKVRYRCENCDLVIGDIGVQGFNE